MEETSVQKATFYQASTSGTQEFSDTQDNNVNVQNRRDEQMDDVFEEDAKTAINAYLNNKKEFEFEASLADAQKKRDEKPDEFEKDVKTAHDSTSILLDDKKEYKNDTSFVKHVSKEQQQQKFEIYKDTSNSIRNMNNSPNSTKEVKFLSDNASSQKKSLSQYNHPLNENEALLEGDESDKPVRFLISHIIESSNINDEKYFSKQKNSVIRMDDSNMNQTVPNGFFQALFAEFLGTYLLVLYVCSFGLPISDPTHQDSPPSINGCLGSGFVLASLVWCLGHVGGAHFNPAVSIALLIVGETSLVRVLCYIPCQLLGSTLAIKTLYEFLPEHLSNANNKRHLSLQAQNDTQKLLFTNSPPAAISPLSSSIGLTLLNENITPVQGFGIEVVITFILLITIFACIDSKRKDLKGSFPLTIGFAIVVGSFFGGKFTGGSMNPARSFGPALINNNWDNHHIYWLGPITGGIIAAIVYKFLVLKRKNT